MWWLGGKVAHLLPRDIGVVDLESLVRGRLRHFSLGAGCAHFVHVYAFVTCGLGLPFQAVIFHLYFFSRLGAGGPFFLLARRLLPR